MSYKRYLIQEGKPIANDIHSAFCDSFEENDLSKKQNYFISKFTGIIIRKNEILLSVPKNCLSDSDLIIDYNIEIGKFDFLLNIIYKTIEKSLKKKSEIGIGNEDEMNNDFPFVSFFGVYEYFLDFGLYESEFKYNKMGYTGKINWKNTIEKSPMIINDGRLLYLPLVIDEKRNQQVFLTKCMAFVIDSTASKLSNLIKFKKTNYDVQDINWKDNEKIVEKLKHLEQQTFKDIHKRLIKNLIGFFEYKDYTSDIFELKVHSFNLIWEDMILEYLQEYFLDVQKNKNQEYSLLFSKEKKQVSNIIEKERFYIDKRGDAGYSIIPDFIINIEDKVFIFDAKYYSEINQLDYKQISYYFLLRKKLSKQAKKKIVSALILPTYSSVSNINGEKNSSYHLDISNEFLIEEDEVVIVQQYVNMIDLMKLYI